MEWVNEVRRELELLQREFATLRDEVAVARGLTDLRREVEQARSEVPRVPEVVSGLEKTQKHLERELAKTKEKLRTVRTNQCIADYRLAELDKATAARSKALELKVETTTQRFEMREVHPDAQRALRDFARETLKSTRRDEKIWVFDPGPAAGTA
jgi:hypothetical protein